MNNHITRLREEQLDLDDKVRKLALFIADEDGVFPTLDSFDQMLLTVQLTIMKAYAEVISKRLERVREHTSSV